MDTLQVVAEPRRRQILAMVWDDELPVGEIAAGFDVSLAAVSQHLSVLKQAGLVKVRKDGNKRIYSADHDALAPFRPILESMWATTLSDLAGAIEAADGDSSE